jgi:hypothetical protein
MRRWISRVRRTERRSTPGFVAGLMLLSALFMAMAMAVVGCSPRDEADADSHDTSQSEHQTEPASAASPSEVEDPAVQAQIELMTREAIESLTRAANFLAEQENFRVVLDISFDVMQDDGRLLEFGSRREVTLRRPDRVRIGVTRRDGDEKTLYFDGSAILIDLAGHQAFVREEYPGTLYAALEHLSDELGTPVPLSNLLTENFAGPTVSQIQTGYSIGQANIDGRNCEHLAFRLDDVDVQMWIEEGDRPLLARVVITHKYDEGSPQFRATLRDWDLQPETPDTLFQFEPAEGSERLAVGSIVIPRAAGAEEVE